MIHFGEIEWNCNDDTTNTMIIFQINNLLEKYNIKNNDQYGYLKIKDKYDSKSIDYEHRYSVCKEMFFHIYTDKYFEMEMKSFLFDTRIMLEKQNIMFRTKYDYSFC